MPRTRIGLTGSALKVVGQVGASMGATLIAAMVFAALPKATVSSGRPVVALTSGGKFAARIPGAEVSGRQNADETLDAVATMSVNPAASAPLSSADTGPNGNGESAEPAASDRPARPKLRLPLRSDAQRSLYAVASTVTQPANMVAAALGSRPPASASLEGAAAKPDNGIVPRWVSSARSLWSATTAAGVSLLARVIP